MPPNCCLCDKELGTADECEFVCFRRTPEHEASYAQAKSRLIPDHPPSCEWFRDDHVEAARSLVSLDLDQSLAKICNDSSPQFLRRNTQRDTE